MKHIAHNQTLSIVAAKGADTDAILRIWNACIDEGETFLWTETFTRSEMTEILYKQDVVSVAVIDCHVVGFYILHPNTIGRGKHIANALYAVDGPYRGRGIGTLLGKHSLEKARELHYTGMQFNSVVTSNRASVNVWMKLGFQIVGKYQTPFSTRQTNMNPSLSCIKSCSHHIRENDGALYTTSANKRLQMRCAV